MRVYPVNAMAGGCKKLRRLPHVFSKMIELPFGADADVYIEEDTTMFRFFAAADGLSGGVRAHAVVVHPGVMKVVVVDGAGAGAGEGDFGEDELEFDRWRFRLPPSTLPRLATAEYVDGELIVTVPKGDGPEEHEQYFEEGNGGFNGSAAGQLVVVQ
ncbi:uncharacterized protein LOC110109842 [Dendrobium catenatum]|uniref:SHSP domain-containing protein n=1 Tax=Dendrobium catenatum TaxID=906689 RepID=A0A2I0XIX2_9ASPA|nr:uncharacterized protein LOC110109842 [Dendrobium catenatum]PKU87866.1 hypothetical protein MA16_Dca027236 [Dendrobium catenatum]